MSLSLVSEGHAAPTISVRQADAQAVELGIAAQVSQLSAWLADSESAVDAEVLPSALRLLCQLLPDGSSASLVRYSRGVWSLAACSQPAPSWFDGLQETLGQGPCWDAHGLDTMTIVSLWSTETRWPQLRAQLPGLPDIGSMVSVPLSGGGHRDLVLNIYARRPGAFDGIALHTVTLAAAGMALIVTALQERTQIEHLRSALESNRRIGAAIGIVMGSLHCSEDEAFLMLRAVSQHTHVKLRTVADEVLYTGAVPELAEQCSAPAERPGRPARQV